MNDYILFENLPPIEKRLGYLNQDFKYFHLKDKKNQDFAYHYHDFFKIVIFLSGKVTYFVEGKSYFLQPYDILLINRYDLHRPVVGSDESYERIVIWFKADFLEKLGLTSCQLADCFTLACQNGYHLLRLNLNQREQILSILKVIEDSLSETNEAFGALLLIQAKLTELLVYLNRYSSGTPCAKTSDSFLYDERIEELMRYISTHLSEDLSIDAIANQFFISKYYLMRKFKTNTGITLHNYILQKRLFHSLELIQKGMPITQAALESGFHDYSVYFKAFKRQFDCLPSEYAKTETLNQSDFPPFTR